MTALRKYYRIMAIYEGELKPPMAEYGDPYWNCSDFDSEQDAVEQLSYAYKDLIGTDFAVIPVFCRDWDQD